MWRSWPRMLGAVTVAALALAGCGDGDDADAQDQAPAADATTPADETAEPTEPAATEPGEQGEAGETVYEVQQGDTLWDIAERHGTTVEAIVEANGIEDPSRIHPGDELVIPGG